MATGGGFKAIRSVAKYTAQIGPLRLVRAVTSKNACKACAFGTGGQKGGLFNESGHGIEICNKNIQAQLSDIRRGIPPVLFAEKSITELAKLGGKQLEDLGRLAAPLYKAAGDQHYRTIDYREALDRIVTHMRTTPPNRGFFYASGRSSNEAAFLLQLLARLWGANNVNNCSFYCHQASGIGLNSVLGSGTATIRYGDLEKADLIFVCGANPASNHPRFLKTLIHCRRRGGQVIVINPAKEPGMVRFASPSDLRSMLKGGEFIASEYIQPNIGGDIALFTGIARHLLEQDKINQTFIEAYTNGFVEYRDAVLASNWHEISALSGIDKQEIGRLADIYANAQNCIFTWGMGMTHHRHGVNNVQAIASLALLRGQLGRPGCGLLPLRGHSNIQGVGSMGFTPKLKDAIFENLQSTLNIRLPTQAGMDTMSSMEASHRGEIDFAWMLGGNLYASNPDATFAAEALDHIPFKIYINSTINTSHLHGISGEVIVLPVRVRDEEQQATTQESMFNFVRLSDGGITRFEQLKSEVEIVTEIGEALIDPSVLDFGQFRQHETIRKTISAVIPGFSQLGKIDADKQEFHIEGRTFYTPQFATADGRANFQVTPLPPAPGKYRLTSVRSEGQFNSIIYHEEDVYREQTERWIVMMHPDDIAKEGLTENLRIDLVSDTGAMRGVKVRAFDIKPGNLMVYYPEANILVPRATDTQSGTPGFKSVDVRLEMPENRDTVSLSASHRSISP